MNPAPAESLAPDILPLRPRLLIVDDQPINIQALYQIFQADHEVFMATSGEQALDFCRRDPPD
ncbi:MAG: diguanylate cyclase response regulator, partial [Rhodocyclaceae bacterium]|nr:diguanylate cyclase response regulator [Rhodocyclaceae bacterium]